MSKGLKDNHFTLQMGQYSELWCAFKGKKIPARGTTAWKKMHKSFVRFLHSKKGRKVQKSLWPDTM